MYVMALRVELADGNDESSGARRRRGRRPCDKG